MKEKIGMKKHLCSILYDLPQWEMWEDGKFNKVRYQFTGYICGTIIDPAILFKKAFGFELPPHTTITIR